MLANLIKDVGTEATSEALEGTHIIDVLNTAGDVVPDTVGRQVTLVKVSSPGRVVVSLDAILENDDVRVGDDIGVG